MLAKRFQAKRKPDQRKRCAWRIGRAGKGFEERARGILMIAQLRQRAPLLKPRLGPARPVGIAGNEIGKTLRGIFHSARLEGGHCNIKIRLLTAHRGLRGIGGAQRVWGGGKQARIAAFKFGYPEFDIANAARPIFGNAQHAVFRGFDPPGQAAQVFGQTIKPHQRPASLGCAKPAMIFHADFGAQRVKLGRKRGHFGAQRSKALGILGLKRAAKPQHRAKGKGQQTPLAHAQCQLAPRRHH